MRSGRAARPGNLGVGDGVEGSGAFSRVNQQVDVGVEDSSLESLARVCGGWGARGYQSNRLKLYSPVWYS